MVHSGYHPLKHRPFRIVLAKMVHSGYHPLKRHPLKHRPLKIVFGWCTVNIILLNIIRLNIVL